MGLLAVAVSHRGILCAQQQPEGQQKPPPPPPRLAAPPVFAPQESPPSIWDEALQSPPAEFSVPTVLELPSHLEPVVVVVDPPKKIWFGRLEIGYNGSEGNSRQYTARGAAKLERKTPDDELTLSIRYTTSSTKTDAGETQRTQENALFDWRIEEFFPDWPWSVYIHGIVEYDAFTAFDYRVTTDAGVAYNLIKNDETTFQLRTGIGFSRKFGVVDEEEAGFIPEASYGLTFEHRVAKRQMLTAKVDVYHDVRDFPDYRAIGEAAWEIFIDEEEHLSLRFSLIDRYDATPGEDSKRNDLTYAAELVWDF